MRTLRNVIEPTRHFRDEPITPVYRHWMCRQDGCDGEMRGTGHGFTQLETNWEHRCDKCNREEWARANYPRVAYLPIEAGNIDGE